MRRTEEKKFALGMLKNQPEHSPKKADTLNLSIITEFCKVADISRKDYSDRYKRSFQERVKYKLFEIVSFTARKLRCNLRLYLLEQGGFVSE